MQSIQFAIAQALAYDLGGKVPALQKVYPEWPEANQLLVYPSATIETQPSTYMRMAPYIVTRGSVANNKAQNTYCVGTYETLLQVDIWSKYKVERDALVMAMFDALQPVSLGGYNLTLAEYFGEVLGFTLTNFKYMDDSESVRQKTWRAMFSLSASCRAINTTTDFIITQAPVLELDILDTNESLGD